MMLLSEFVFDLFIWILLNYPECLYTLKFKRTMICAYLLIYLKSPIIIIYKLIYWRNTRLYFISQDLFLFNVDLMKSSTVLMQSSTDQLYA